MFKNYKILINNFNNELNHKSFNYDINNIDDINNLYDIDLLDYDDYKKYVNMFKVKFNNIKDCYEFEKKIIDDYYIYIQLNNNNNYNDLYNTEMKKYHILSNDSFIRLLFLTYKEIYKISNKIFNHPLLILDDLDIIINKLINNEDFLNMLFKGTIFLHFIEKYFDIE